MGETKTISEIVDKNKTYKIYALWELVVNFYPFKAWTVFRKHVLKGLNGHKCRVVAIGSDKRKIFLIKGEDFINFYNNVYNHSVYNHKV